VVAELDAPGPEQGGRRAQLFGPQLAQLALAKPDSGGLVMGKQTTGTSAPPSAKPASRSPSPNVSSSGLAHTASTALTGGMQRPGGQAAPPPGAGPWQRSLDALGPRPAPITAQAQLPAHSFEPVGCLGGQLQGSRRPKRCEGVTVASITRKMDGSRSPCAPPL
jgi:hypothetical protein